MRLQFVALALVVTIAGTPTFAGDDGHDGKHVRQGDGERRVLCPHCGDACYPTVTKGKETKTCWNVETIPICIPKVRFPWENSCCSKGCGKDGCVPPKCGRTKYVNVLMKHEYECSTCKYSWDVNNYKHNNGNCDKVPAGEPEEVGPAVADPPPVEASLPQSNRRVAPAVFKQISNVSPAKMSYAEIVTSFFN